MKNNSVKVLKKPKFLMKQTWSHKLLNFFDVDVLPTSTKLTLYDVKGILLHLDKRNTAIKGPDLVSKLEKGEICSDQERPY